MTRIKGCCPLTPRVTPSVLQSFLTFDFMDRSLQCDHCRAALIYCGAVCFFTLTRFVILENLSPLADTFRCKRVKCGQELRMKRPVVRSVNNTTQQINRYLVDKTGWMSMLTNLIKIYLVYRQLFWPHFAGTTALRCIASLKRCKIFI